MALPQAQPRCSRTASRAHRAHCRRQHCTGLSELRKDLTDPSTSRTIVADGFGESFTSDAETIDRPDGALKKTSCPARAQIRAGQLCISVEATTSFLSVGRGAA